MMFLQLIIGLGLLVALHELGHFLFARLFGMRVEKFTIFVDLFNINLFKFKKGETEYSIGWLPFGGYVKIAGMVDESMDKDQLKEPPKPDEFRAKPAWQRIMVLLGGVIVNFVVAIVVFCLLLFFGDKGYVAAEDVSDGIYVYEPGLACGFESGDQLISVNGEKLIRFKDATSPGVAYGGEITYEVKRGNEIVTVVVPDTLAERVNELFSVATFPAVIDTVINDYPAAEAGIMKGDIITSINEFPVTQFGDIINILSFKLAEADSIIELGYARNGENLTATINVGSEKKLGVDGVRSDFELTPYSIGSAISYGTKDILDLGYANIKGIASLFSGEKDLRKSLVGPVGIAKIYGSNFSFYNFWRITAVISLILAITNLIPIPALDGGHILIIIVESIVGRELPDKVKMAVQLAGVIILVGLIVFSVVNDIINF